MLQVEVKIISFSFYSNFIFLYIRRNMAIFCLKNFLKKYRGFLQRGKLIMLDGVSKEFIEKQMSAMPEYKKGDKHVVQKGESLWRIAQKQLGENANKAQLTDYMYALAKVNGLDTSYKMNNLKINQELYLPEGFTVEKTNTTDKTPAAANNKKVDKPQSTNASNPIKATKNTNNTQETKTTPAVTTLTQAEMSFGKRLNTVLKDPKVRVERASVFSNSSGIKIYHVLTEKKYPDGTISKNSPVMTFNLDNTGKISDISFEDDKNINIYGYDYRINGTNKIVGFQSYDKKIYGTVPKDQMKLLTEKLTSLIPKESRK